ncbi:cupin domain-containing protein [Streptomyces sp. NPDC050095]|uniref:cupin domain-containing protein n=1 Tax=unclassified Streptomyces TaxID=2593676 RepID=UPI00341E6452
MTDGLLLSPGAGRRIEAAGMTLKVGVEHTPRWSMFEAEIGVGFDVGAHLHQEAEEVFYVLEGELDLLAFEPLERTGRDWQTWESREGRKVLRGAAGSAMYVPAGCPHAFANPGPSPARLLFLVAPAGHEQYLREMGDIIASAGGPPDQDAIAALRLRYDIEQLTPLVPGRP